MWKTQNTMYLFLIEILNGIGTWKQTDKFLECLNIELSNGPTISPLGVEPRKCICTAILILATIVTLLIITQRWEHLWIIYMCVCVYYRNRAIDMDRYTYFRKWLTWSRYQVTKIFHDLPPATWRIIENNSLSQSDSRGLRTKKCQYLRTDENTCLSSRSLIYLFLSSLIYWDTTFDIFKYLGIF